VLVPPVPDGYTWSLPLLYLVTAVVVTLLYFPLAVVRAAEGGAAGLALAQLPLTRRHTW